MDLITFLFISGIFTAFGYIWGSTSVNRREEVSRIVSTTMDSLEKQGYLRSEMIKGELHYIKWPSESNNDSNT